LCVRCDGDERDGRERENGRQRFHVCPPLGERLLD
jgi:hypothetical protein